MKLYFVFISSFILNFFISSARHHGKKFVLVAEEETAFFEVNNEGGIDEWRKDGEPLQSFHGNTTASGYEYSCEGNNCVFKIENVSKEKTGVYAYQWIVESRSNFKDFVLVIGALSCSLSVPEVLVGPNDCQGVKAEKIEGLCKLHHTTNEDFIPPIKWRVKGSRGEEVLVPASFNRPRKVDSAEKDTSWELTDKISVGKKWEVFECYVEKTSLSCSEKFAPKSLLWAHNKSHEELTSYTLHPMTLSTKRSVRCQAAKSAGVYCTYQWFHQASNIRTEFEGSLLHQDNLLSSGTYQCLAHCVLHHNNPRKCVLLADRFQFVLSNKTSVWLILLLLLLILPIFLVIAAFLFYKKRMRRKKDQTKKDQLLSNNTTIPATANTPAATTNPPAEANTTTNPRHLNTPAPRSRPSLENSIRRSFKRTSSNKSSMEVITEEGEDSVSKRERKITLNDSKGSVMGVGVMGDRIYCVCSDSTRLFVYHRQPPHNRIKPEEVNLENLTKPTDLAICEQKTSVFICNYTDDRTIYRVFVGTDQQQSGVCSCVVDGDPASMCTLATDHTTAAVVLKRQRQLHVELYQISACTDQYGVVVEKTTWHKKFRLTLTSDVKFPLKACLSASPPSSSDHQSSLALLYASGSFSSKRFERYSLAHYDLKDGSFKGKVFDFHTIHSSFVPSSMVSAHSLGGVYVLRSGSSGAFWHLDPTTQRFKSQFPVKNSGIRFCTDHPSVAAVAVVVGCGNHRANSYLVCKQLDTSVKPAAI